ncbi:MAG: prepilin-type N-terminal cleavage/methylation domain-containing protein, partial [Lachnospiraceae bacterium]|nr:prepilin-type N-terminal cleavage/methylation domain-containing protein [Lachnospiraceae bacterium]
MIQMKKLNNKGFSLVELIIVIAIMAILVGVVGTQVIPYLEN